MNDKELKRKSKTARYKLGTRHTDSRGKPWVYVYGGKPEATAALSVGSIKEGHTLHEQSQ